MIYFEVDDHAFSFLPLCVIARIKKNGGEQNDERGLAAIDDYG